MIIVNESFLAAALFSILLIVIGVCFALAARDAKREINESKNELMKNQRMRFNIMSDLINREFLLSIGFVKCDQEWINSKGHDIYFYDHCDVFIHFTGIEQEIEVDTFTLTNVISKTDLIEHLINHKENSVLDNSQNC